MRARAVACSFRCVRSNSDTRCVASERSGGARMTRAVEGVGFPGVLGRAIPLAILIGVLVPGSASAGVRAAVVGTFSHPTYIAAPPGDTHALFVVQQSGQIELIKDGGKPTTFLDISSKVTFAGERGLLSMALSPDYAMSGRFYVYYTTNYFPRKKSALLSIWG
jgi:hypothetical protein